MMTIRPATLSDSDRIAEILADGWARAYGGFLPPEVLAPRIDYIARRHELHEFMADKFDAATEAMMVAERDGRVVGFVHAVLGDKGELGTGGYVSLLYVDAESGGQGIGRRLLAEAADWLGGKTDGSIAIAGFNDNPFHPFYAHLGGRIAKISDVSIDGFACQSVIYLWASANELRQQAQGTA